MKFNLFSAGIRSAALISLATLWTGCAAMKYHPVSAPGTATAADYPIPVYSGRQQPPRPCRIIGTVAFRADSWTMIGGSATTEMKRIMRLAHQKGADVVYLTEPGKPDFTNPNFKLGAELLRYTDCWETNSLTRLEFERYLDGNRATLDPIEGIWSAHSIPPELIGIMRDHSRPGREFIGFVLESDDPLWGPGMKQMDIRRGSRPGSYLITYYLHDFEPRDVLVELQQRRSFTITVWKGDDNGTVIPFMKQ